MKLYYSASSRLTPQQRLFGTMRNSSGVRIQPSMPHVPQSLLELHRHISPSPRAFSSGEKAWWSFFVFHASKHTVTGWWMMMDDYGHLTVITWIPYGQSLVHKKWLSFADLVFHDKQLKDTKGLVSTHPRLGMKQFRKKLLRAITKTCYLCVFSR